jgi:hypothetical protein
MEISDVVGPSPVHITLCNKKGKEDISRLFNLIIQGLNKKIKKKKFAISEMHILLIRSTHIIYHITLLYFAHIMLKKKILCFAL